ncbi:platelet-activating factor acetylhydrolase isoform X2 [Hydra vulgaris]|uniref:1-alkyl-2-acetylglycerophosphocholine esterase n=1 Tax=Hydra vulgaris TaxID=6087 RepID=A0ABM4BQW4_HYDVU
MSFIILANMVIKYSGPHHVGCLDLMLKSAKIVENFHPDVLSCSDLGSLMRLFYPSEPPSQSSKKATWLPEPNQDQYFEAYVRELRFGYFTKKLLSFWKSFSLPIFVNEQLVKHQELRPVFNNHTLPVIIFSHGLMGHRSCYTEFCAQLASEGYLVVAVEHRDGSAISSYIKDDKSSRLVEIPYHESPTKDSPETTAQRYVQVEQRSKEISKALDIVELLNKDPTLIENCLETGNFSIGDFQGRIDLSKPFLIGHSFGGATVIDTLNKDNRFKCGVGLDVWFTALTDESFSNPGKQSVLLIFTEYFNWKSNLQKTYNYIAQKEKGATELITLKAADHYDQSDIPGIIPTFFHPFLRGFLRHRISYTAAIDVQRKVISDYFKKCYNKQDGSCVNLIDDEYKLSPQFLVGSNIKLSNH